MSLYPNSFPGARGFARWMLSGGRLQIAPDLSRIKLFRDLCTEVILFRDGCWQCELVCAFPNAMIPMHRHLRADSCELALGGGAAAVIGEEIVGQIQRGSLAANLIRVPSGKWHGGKIGPKGCVWLSFQHWLQGEPTWLTDDWEEK